MRGLTGVNETPTQEANQMINTLNATDCLNYLESITSGSCSDIRVLHIEIDSSDAEYPICEIIFTCSEWHDQPIDAGVWIEDGKLYGEW